MKDQVFTDSNQYSIPSFDLMHDNNKVSFAFRTMEYIYDKTGGKPDVPHRHNYYTVLWARQACGKHFIDYREYNIEPNVVFFVSPGQVHQVITHSRPIGMAIMFTSDFLLKNNISCEFFTNLGLFFDHPDMPPIKVDAQTAEALDRIGHEMEQAFAGSQTYRFEAIGAWLRLFLIECNKVVDFRPEQHTQSLQSGRQLVSDFKKLVESHFSEWHKVSDYASELNISSDYLNNVIKTNIGINAKDFIQNRLILEAKRMGVHTELSSKEIAFSIGFDDPAHFSKFYKTNTGESFSDFRNSLELSLKSR